MSKFLTPFPILLNDLSHALNDENVQSLIHLCGELIPGGQQGKIRSGWDVFKILRHENIIGIEPEKMVNLLSIMKALKPKRKDLVDKVKRHIADNCEEPEKILKDFESSGDSLSFFSNSRSSTPIPTEKCCSIRCHGFTCYCNPSCDADGCCVITCGILATSFFILTLVAVLAWYSRIPRITKHLNSTEDLRDAGPFVVGILVFFTALCIGLCARVIYIRYVKRRAYAVIPRSRQTSNQGSLGSSGSTRTSDSRRIDQRSIQYSCSPNQYTALGSLGSRASSRSPALLEESEVVPDGVPQDSYPEVFTQEVEQEEGELQVV